MSQAPIISAVPTPPARQSHKVFWLILAVLSAGYMALWVWSRWTDFPYADIAQRIAAPGLAVLPFVPLILFATLGREEPTFRGAAVVYWLLLGFAAVAYSGLLAFGALVDHDRNMGNARDAFPLGSLSKIASILFLSVGSVFAGLLCYTPSMRRIAARWVPMDPDSFPDAVALATIVALVLGNLAPLAVLHEPVGLAVIRQAPVNVMKDESVQLQLINVYAQLAWTIPVALLAAGYPLIRTFRETLRRLGLVLPTPSQMLYALVAAMALVAFMLVIEQGINKIWTYFDWPRTDNKAFEDMIRFAKSGAGAVAIGITAGLGEELTFRGLLQPRIGILGANLLFTAVHAQQYHLDGLTSVFIIGLILGFIRQRFNTTTAALVHGLYDFFLVIGMLIEAPGFQ